MKRILDLLSRLNPLRILLSFSLLAMLIFSSASPALAARSNPDQGTVQLDQITQKSEETADTPAELMNPIEKPPEGGLNEVQGTADRDKMYRSKDTRLPVVKQVEEALKK
jgi:hypothetical protein